MSEPKIVKVPVELEFDITPLNERNTLFMQETLGNGDLGGEEFHAATAIGATKLTVSFGDGRYGVVDYRPVLEKLAELTKGSKQ